MIKLLKRIKYLYTTRKNRKLWVKELRSENWIQGKYYLAQPNGKYCCLGVACELYQREVGDLEIFEHLDSYIVYDNHYENLPEKVRIWLGLRKNNGDYHEDNLADMNDNDICFDEIADVIEEEPKGLLCK